MNTSEEKQKTTNDKEKDISEIIIGIDLGTTNSCVAIMEDGNPRVLENSEDKRTTPSVVSYDEKNKRILVGERAKKNAAFNPGETIFSIKSEMGQRVKKVLGGKEYTPEQISAIILQHLVSEAEGKLKNELHGKRLARVVITIPARFGDDARIATENAGKIAGLKVERIINEPTAAALAYGLDKSRGQKILVYDLGGGTFDVSILEVKEVEGVGVFEVISVEGDEKLGGDNFDSKIFNYVIKEFKKLNGIDLLTEVKEKDKILSMMRLKAASKEIKENLSGNLTENFSVPFIPLKDDRVVNVDIEITRAKFEELCEDYLKKTANEVDKALKNAKHGELKKQDINQVILVGGSTRMPMVEKLIKEKFGEKKVNKSVNPDTVVAVGAAIQGGVLKGDEKSILLLDVAPLSLGIKIQKGGDFENFVLVKRNDTIPIKKTEIFTTAEDNQTSVHIQVLQGERPKASDNKVLGNFELTGIAPAPRATPQIEVTFEVDASGILRITATDLQSKKKESLTIEGGQGLSKEEIERMVQDAEKNRARDEEWKANQELLNRGQTFCRTFGNQIEEFKKRKDFKEDDPEFQKFKKMYDNLKETVKAIEEAKEENEKKIKLLELEKQVKKVDEMLKIAQQLEERMSKEKKEDEGYASGEGEDTFDVKPNKDKDKK